MGAMRARGCIDSAVDRKPVRWHGRVGASAQALSLGREGLCARSPGGYFPLRMLRRALAGREGCYWVARVRFRKALLKQQRACRTPG